MSKLYMSGNSNGILGSILEGGVTSYNSGNGYWFWTWHCGVKCKVIAVHNFSVCSTVLFMNTGIYLNE